MLFRKHTATTANHDGAGDQPDEQEHDRTEPENQRMSGQRRVVQDEISVSVAHVLANLEIRAAVHDLEVDLLPKVGCKRCIGAFQRLVLTYRAAYFADKRPIPGLLHLGAEESGFDC